MTTTPSLTSQLGLSLASKQTQAMAPAATPPAAVAPPTSAPSTAPTSGAGTTTNTQTGQVFQNATQWPYTQANATNAANIASNPVYKAPATNNALGAPLQPLSYFVSQNPNDRKTALSQFQAQKKPKTATDNYNAWLQAQWALNSTLNSETTKQNTTNEVKFAQDAQDSINNLNTQNGLQTQMSDLSYQNSALQAQNNLDSKKQAAAYLAGGIGQPWSSVGLAGQSKDIQDATTFLNNLGIGHGLQNSYNANNLAYQVNGIKKQIDLNVSSAVQNALVQVGKLESMWDLNSVESILKARSDIISNLQGIKQQMTEQNIPYLKALMDEDIKNHTVDQNVTNAQNNGTLYNAMGTPILSPNGQPLKIANYSGKLLSQSPITLTDGSSALVYQNADGTLRTEKIKDTGTMLSDDATNTFARMIAMGTAKIDDIPKGMQNAVLSQVNNYNAAGNVIVWNGNLSGSILMKALASGTYNGTKFFGAYASGDPTGQNRANIYDNAQNMGLEAFISHYKGTTITPEMVTASASKFGVDPLMVATVLAADSSMGTNWYGKSRGLPQNNNPGNYGQNDSDSAKGINHAMPTMEAGVDAVAQNLQHRLQAMKDKLGTTQTTPGSYTDAQKSMMAGMDAKNISVQDQKMLASLNLQPQDVYSFKSSQTANTWKAGLNNTTIKDVQSVADDFYKSKVATEFDMMQKAYLVTQSAGVGTSATDNQALIYAFAKAMDPTSVVREGEYATVQKYSQTWSEKLGMNINRILDGQEFLSEEARKRIIATVKWNYDANISQYENYRQTYAKRIDGTAGKSIWNDVLPSAVMSSWAQQNTPPAGGAPSSSGSVQVNGNTYSTTASNGKTYEIKLK